jgi:hypothetical protein
MDALAEVEAEAAAMTWSTRNVSVGAASGDIQYSIKMYQVGMRRCIGRRIENGDVKVIKWLPDELANTFAEDAFCQAAVDEDRRRRKFFR